MHLGEGPAVRLGPAARVGVDDDVGRREGVQHPVLGRHDHLVRRLQGQLRVEVDVHLDVHVGPGRAGAQLVDVGQPPVLRSSGRRSGRGPRRAARGPSAGPRPRGTRRPRPTAGAPRWPAPPTASSRPIPSQAAGADAGQRDDVGGEVGGVVRPVAGDRHRRGLLQHPALGDDQQRRSARWRRAITAIAQPPCLDRLRMDQVGDRLAGRSGRPRRTPGPPAPGSRTPRPCRGR